ncbi:MAG: carboxypeptidase-like regulatory domain-containing protein, partial [Saprospiraceae bacterium]
ENRGEVVHTEEIKPTQISQYQLKIPTENLPIGMSRITIIDESHNALAQRLVFLNQDKQLDISVKTDKELYLPREKINAEITVKDHNGKPIKGNFSMSVVDENLLKLADDKQGNILSQMLLQSDLKGEIEEPNFYFETDEVYPDGSVANDRIDRQKALDLLMMTQGWRRYEWRHFKRDIVPLVNEKERKIIAGKIMNGGKYDLSKTTIKVEGTNISTKPDAQGNFAFESIDLYEPKTLLINHPDLNVERKVFVNRYQDDLKLHFFPSKGQVIDKDTGEPLPFATIVVKDQKIGVQTDWDGYFDLAELMRQANQAGIERPDFHVEYIGYRRQQFTFEQLENSNNEIFKIEVEDHSVMLDEVVIQSANRPRIGSRNKSKRNKTPRKTKEKLSNKQPESRKPVKKGNVNIDKFSKISNATNDNRSAAKITATNVVYYYKPRTFQSPKYKSKKPKTRTDFQTTIYWNGNIQTDENGTANVEFTNVDAITTYRITVEGFGQNGDVGFQKNSLVSSMSFALKLKLPTQLTDGDLIDLPITLVNNSDKKLSGKLKLSIPSNLKIIDNFNANQTLQPNEAKTVFVKCKAFVPTTRELETLKVSFKNDEWNDAIERTIKVESNGFPINMAFADANVMEKAYTFEVSEPIENSANVSLKLMPTVLNQVFNDLENMMRQPYGCFEQTSSSNYPNVLALQYMREMDKTNLKIEAKAMKFLADGYKRLTSFECKNGGFEWFGHDPAHEGLTAYGLMQFVDMSEVFPVSEIMINRTAKWLLSRRDEKGGWNMNERSLHSWAGTPEIFNAYITWAVSEVGYSNKLKKELDKAYDDAIKTEDVYVMALAANALLNANDKRGKVLLDDIVLRQKENGSWEGLKHSIVHSRGQGLTIETTSLVMLAMMKDNRYGEQIRKANDFLMKARNAYGFGNTQSTVMALKAIVEYAKTAQKSQKGGQVTVYLNDNNIGNFTYSENQTKDILLNNLVTNLPKGKQEIKVKFTKTKTPIPFQINVNYTTTLPLNDKYQQVDLTTKLLQTTVKQGETVRYEIKLKNVNNMLRNTPIAIVGIPAGTSPQLWQLKKLQKEGVFDYYESFNGYLVFYYRTIKSMEEKTINLDLKAEVKGRFSAPASSAYLYYMSEYKTWTKAETLKIN